MGNGNPPKGTSSKVEWVKALGPYVVIFTVVIAGFIDRDNLISEMEEKAATRLLNNIILLDKSNSCTVRAGAVTTMGEHLRGDYMHQYRTIQVAAYHLGEEDDTMVRTAIVNLLEEANVDVINTLASVNKVVIDRIEKRSGEGQFAVRQRLLESLIQDEFANEEDSLACDKLLAINKALVTLIRKTNREGLDLSGIFLVSSERINLDNANLRRANLRHALLYKPELNRTNLHGAVLEDASAADAFFEGADLKDAILVRANLESAVLREADLTDADVSDANLNFANLESAILERAILLGTQLERANLKGANLAGANLMSANLDGADLRAMLLFSIDSKKFQGDLDKGTISQELRQEFEQNLINLSENTTVSTKVEDKEWLIDDEGNQKTYIVRKEERLNICKRTKFDLEGIKQASNWEKAIFDDDIWEKLSSPQN
jgi:uncharacterized protein YjbI with pentapeptide repeats